MFISLYAVAGRRPELKIRNRGESFVPIVLAFWATRGDFVRGAARIGSTSIADAAAPATIVGLARLCTTLHAVSRRILGSTLDLERHIIVAFVEGRRRCRTTCCACPNWTRSL